MRMRLQALKSCTDTPLHLARYLDLSNKEIVAIEGLHHCPSLESLALRCNYIDLLCNLDYCRNLWQLDLTGNRVKSVLGMSQFPALGSLQLAYNEVTWRELNRLRHMHILSVTLLGNPQLDSDPNYRQHVISMLPHVWMLDSVLITAKERSKVNKFFKHSKNSARPVWCKSATDNFVPTTMKNLFVQGKFGPKTAEMMQQFPINYKHSTELDQRRLSYLARGMEEQVKLENKCDAPLGLQLIIANRNGESAVDQCNMLLLLLLASLRYKIPPVAMAAAYNTARLDQICDGTDHIEKLSYEAQLSMASLLLSAVAMDQEYNTGLPTQLFDSVMTTFQTIQRQFHAERANRSPWKLTHQQKEQEIHNENVLASEVVQMFCLVPTIIDMLLHQSNPGIVKLVTIATKNLQVMDTVVSIATSSPSDKEQQNVATYLMDVVKHNVLPQKPSSRPKQRRHSTPSMGGRHDNNMYTTRIKSAGNMIGYKSPLHQGKGISVSIGDIVLLGNQGLIAKVMSDQENHLVLLQTISDTRSHFMYVNVDQLTWNHGNSCWETDVRWLDSSVDMATHSSQSVLSEEDLPSGCHGHDSSVFPESTGDVEVPTKRTLSLLVDMSSKSIGDVGMATNTVETINQQPQSQDTPPSLPSLWNAKSSQVGDPPLSADHRIQQRHQLKNNDLHLVQPHPPPTSPVHQSSSHTPLATVQHAWGPVHPTPSTRHTLTSYSRLVHRKQHVVKTSHTVGGGALVLQTNEPRPPHYHDRMPVHRAQSLLYSKPYKWLSTLDTAIVSPTRKLGNLLSVTGSSLH